MNEIKNSKEIAHSCINILASEITDAMLVMCYDADLHKMQLTSAGKKNTYVCFDPVWRYFRLSILSYFAATERSDQ